MSKKENKDNKSKIEKNINSKKKIKIFNKNNLKKFYINNYKKLIIIPIMLLILSTISIIMTIKEEGTPIYRDISLKGGLSAIFEINNPNINEDELKTELKKEFESYDFLVSNLIIDGKNNGFIIDTNLEEKKLVKFMENKFNTKFDPNNNYSSSFIAPSLSKSFFKQAINILIISFALMSTVIFLYFREFVPSFAIVLSAIFDIIVTIGILDFLNIPISISGIGALLMLIGYSIDTDVLLTNRVIREKGDDYFEKTFFAFKTGVLMSATTLIAGIGALFLTNSEVIYEISLILVIGLIVDFISTWLQNTGILLWWINKKKN
jgi:preprotein translocase subunit SecF